MAKRRTISYRNTALLSVVGGAISLAVAIGEIFTRTGALELGVAGTVISGFALVAWFLAAAAGVLALSTDYRRLAIAGLVLCSLAILIFLLAPTIAGG
jgi:hypothetical protein